MNYQLLEDIIFTSRRVIGGSSGSVFAWAFSFAGCNICLVVQQLTFERIDIYIHTYIHIHTQMCQPCWIFFQAYFFGPAYIHLLFTHKCV
ncbi:hypothetical protein CICLE_v10007006mg [Citrus x clementina]|uniref:Uncharacterized protein n=1 Tax=Citrus clementina TaxID=85681 RepID=V4RHE1_CITCL|nr:hypothetical protein CICLE_v10007006mg [Citrus x clementina]